MKKVLVTGGTGFLGKEVVPLLRRHFQVTLLSRKGRGRGRGRNDLKADLTRWDAGLNPQMLKGEYAAILHMAGLYDMRAPEEDLYMNNVFATHTMLGLAQKADIPLFVNTSTIAVAINQKRTHVSPYELNLSQPFTDNYAKTKAQAEELVRKWIKPPTTRINLRLGALVGSTTTGEIHRIDGPYHVPESVKKVKKLLQYSPFPIPLPGKSDVLLPIVPVDAAAKAIVNITVKNVENPAEGYRSYHITPKAGLAPLDLYQDAFRFYGMGNKTLSLFSRVPDFLAKKTAHWLIDLPAEELEYFLNVPIYDSSDTEKILGNHWCPEYSEYKSKLWKGYEKYISNCRY